MFGKKSKKSVKDVDKKIANTKVQKLVLFRRTAIIVGVIFIIDLVMNGIGSSMIESILDKPDYLIELSANKSMVMTGMLLETICAICLLSIGILMYPILKRYNQTIARGYFGIRIIETVIAVGFVISHLLLFALSQDYVNAVNPDLSYYRTIGILIQDGHDLSYQIYLIFYSLGCLMLYGLLLKTKLVPRILSVWGLAGVVVALTGLGLEMYGFNIGMEMYAMPLGLAQIALAVWLIVKGFDPAAIANSSVKVVTF